MVLKPPLFAEDCGFKNALERSFSPSCLQFATASSRDRSGGKTSTRVSVASPFAELGAKAAKENRAALEAFNETLAALEAEKHQVWQKLRQLDLVLAGQIQVSPLNEAAMQQLIDQPNTAILSFYTTSNDTYIFVLRQNQIKCYICPGQGQKTLQDWIEQNWLKPYLASCNSAKLIHEREQLRAVWTLKGWLSMCRCQKRCQHSLGYR